MEKRKFMNHKEVMIMMKKVIRMTFVIMLVLFAGQAAAFGSQEDPDWKIMYTTKSLCYVGTNETVVIPPSVTSLDQFAFYGNGFVKTIIIPDTVQCIPNYSIYNVPNLVNVIFYGNPVIAKYGIYKCPKLRSITSSRKGTHSYLFAERMNIPVKIGYEVGFPKRIVHLVKGDVYRQVLCNTVESPISWKSSKKSVATVNANGVVKARKKGKTRITAITRNGKYSYTVKVYKKTVKQRVKQIGNEEAIKEKTNFERIKSVHSWMIKNIQYDYKNYLKGRIPKASYTVKGALLKKLCVCAGYAKAFKKLMKAYHIPCKVVSGKAGGGGHAWNMVKLDGKWYHVDVTWDDPIIEERNDNTKVYYTYFLKSTKYMMAHKHSFKVSSYPTCSSKKYDKEFDF